MLNCNDNFHGSAPTEIGHCSIQPWRLFTVAWNVVNRFSPSSLWTAYWWLVTFPCRPQTCGKTLPKHPPHIPKVHTDIWWPRRSTKCKLKSVSAGSSNVNGNHSKIKQKKSQVEKKLMVTVWLTEPAIIIWAFFSIWKINQSSETLKWRISSGINEELQPVDIKKG